MHATVVTTQVIALGGALLLIAAGLAHLRSLRRLRAVLLVQGVFPRRSLGLLARCVVAAELIVGVGVLTFLPGALYAQALLYLAFAAYAGLIRLKKPAAPCGCFADGSPVTAAVLSEIIPSQVRPVIERTRVGRRSVLRGIMNTGMVVGLTAIGLLSPVRRAFAADPYPTRRDCTYPDTWKGDCNPNTRPPTSVGGQFCAGGWHRTDGRRINTCEYESYRIEYRCGARPGGGNYNAWEWRRGQTGGNKRSARCSDGRVYVTDRCGPEWNYKSACRVWL